MSNFVILLIGLLIFLIVWKIIKFSIKVCFLVAAGYYLVMYAPQFVEKFLK